MRKIVSGLFISLDGVVEAPDTWIGSYFSDEVEQTVGSLMAAGDTLLLGRVTYQEFAFVFGSQTGETAEWMNSTPKVVLSKTLASAGWQNSTLIGSHPVEAITKLKQEPGRNINVSGSATLVRWLLRQRLLDQLDLLLFPLVVGGGKRLFDGDAGRVALGLTGCHAFSNGVLHLTYRPY